MSEDAAAIDAAAADGRVATIETVSKSGCAETMLFPASCDRIQPDLRMMVDVR